MTGRQILRIYGKEQVLIETFHATAFWENCIVLTYKLENDSFKLDNT